MQDRRQFLVGTLSSGLVFAAQPTFASVTVSDLILRHSNSARRTKGVRKVRRSTKLDRAADYYAQHLARSGVFSHTADGRTLKQRLRKHGVGNGWMAENLAYRSSRHPGDSLAKLFVQGWLDSPGHRRNLLHPKLTHIGIGVAKTQSRVYAVQVFWGG